MKLALIVDDLYEGRYFLKVLLEGHGFKVLEASNGIEALSIAKKNYPDIIISDALMPEMDGFNLCKEWMQDSSLRHIPFVFYSATYTSVEDQKLAIELGAKKYLFKPLEPEIVLSEIKSVLDEVSQKDIANTALDPVDELSFYRQHSDSVTKKLLEKISQLEETNAKLIDSESRYRKIYQSIRDIYIEFSIEGVVTEINDEIINFSKGCITPDNIINHNIKDFLRNDIDFGKFWKLIAQQDLIQDCELNFVNPDGTIIPSSISCSLNDELEFSCVIRDISKRKQIDVVLQHNRELLDQAQKISHMGSWEFDFSSSTYTCSTEIYNILELETFQQGFSEHQYIELTHPEDKQIVLDSISAVKKGTKRVKLQHRLLLPDQRIKYINFIAQNFFDSDGCIYKSVYIVHDISDRIEDERQLAFQNRRAEALLKLPVVAEQMDEDEFIQYALAIMENLTESQISFIHFVNPDQNIIELGTWSKNTLLTHCNTIHDKHYPIQKAGIWANALRFKKAILINNYMNYPQKNDLPDGHAELIRFINIPVIENDKVVMLTGVGNKVCDYNNLDTETVQLISNELWRLVKQKRSDIQLRKLALVVEQSPESIIVTDRESKIEYVNLAFTKTSGYSLNEVIGKKPNFLKSGKTPDSTYKELWDSLLQGKIWKGEFYNKNKAGIEYIEFAIIAPIRQLNNEITHYVAVKEDITEKKRIGEELERYQHHLEEVIKERTFELELARKNAETANRAKSSFLANMSHEIRTPIGSIVGITHLLNLSNLDNEYKLQLKKINDSAEHLLSIINDILDLSKIESGKMSIEKTNFHVEEIFNPLKSLLKDRAENKGIKLFFDYKAIPIWLKGDPTRLRQALLNYLSNALKFTNKGKITVRAEILDTRNKEVTLKFIVEDTGIGVKTNNKLSLFDAFEQEDSSTTRKYGGTGLGLAITKHLVHLMGGQVGIESKENIGSLFWFTANLHIGKPMKRGNVGYDIVIPDNLSEAKVLLVDDNNINREVVAEIIKKYGLLVDTACNGLDAVNKVINNGYDIVLMDIQMPEMDGLEATQKILASPDNGNLPIIAMTANVFEDDKLACEKAGMVDFIPKPVEPELLISLFKKWLPHNIETKVAPAKREENRKVLSEKDQWLYDKLSTYTGLDIVSGVRHMNGNLLSYLKMVRRFTEKLDFELTLLTELIKKNNYDKARFITHSLKGTSSTLGFLSIHESIDQLNNSLKSSSQVVLQNVFSLCDKIIIEQKQLSNIVKEWQQIEELNPPVETDTHKLKEIIEQLIKLVKRDDMYANQLFQEHKTTLVKNFAEKIKKLELYMDNFDYPSSLKLLNSLISSFHTQDNVLLSDGANEIFDQSILDKIYGSEPLKIKAILNKFITQSEMAIEEANKHRVHKDFKSLSELTYKLKSTAGSVGAIALDKCFSDCLKYSDKNDLAKVSISLTKIKNEIELFKSYIHNNPNLR